MDLRVGGDGAEDGVPGGGAVAGVEVEGEGDVEGGDGESEDEEGEEMEHCELRFMTRSRWGS